LAGWRSLPLNWTGPYPDPKVQVDAIVTPEIGFAVTLGDCNYWGYPAATAMLKVYGNGNVVSVTAPGGMGHRENEYHRRGRSPADGIGSELITAILLAQPVSDVNGNLVAKDIPMPSLTTGVGFNSDSGLKRTSPICS